jgi:hypothetical protein
MRTPKPALRVIDTFRLGEWKHKPGEAIPCVLAMKRKHRGNSYIYAIRRPDTGAVKIGRTWDVAIRMQILQSANDVDLKLILCFVCIDEAERLIHEMLAPWRLRGEWFSSSVEVEDWLVRQAKEPNVIRFVPGTTKSTTCDSAVSVPPRRAARRGDR